MGTEGGTAGAVRLEPTSDPARWAAACRASGQPVTPYQSYPFLELAGRMTGTRWTALIVCAGGTDVGVAPWLRRPRGPLGVVNHTPFPYVGPLVPRPQLGATLRALARRGLRDRVAMQEQQFPPGTDFPDAGSAELAAALPAGFELSHDRTFVIDTSQGEEALWGALKRTTRQNLDKASRLGIEVVATVSGRRVLAEIEQATIDRKGLEVGYPHHFPPAPEDLDRDGLQGHWLVAVQGEDELAGLILLRYGEQGCMWVGGVHPRHRSTQANVAMYWAGIRWAAEQGVTTLDMSGIPDAGIERFKRQFGGELVEYPVLRRYLPGWQRAQRLHAGSRARLDAWRGRGR